MEDFDSPLTWGFSPTTWFTGIIRGAMDHFSTVEYAKLEVQFVPASFHWTNNAWAHLTNYQVLMTDSSDYINNDDLSGFAGVRTLPVTTSSSVSCSPSARQKSRGTPSRIPAADAKSVATAPY